jgi:uncharacterized membrane protein
VTATAVRALPVQPEPLWMIDFRQRIAVSLWFVPTIFAAAAVGVAFLAYWLDGVIGASVRVRFGLAIDPSVAASLAGTIAAATLAFVAVVFATTLVAIQLAASQYSPRTVRIFIRSRLTRVTLGLFLATFVFAMIVLISGPGSIPAARQVAPVASVTLMLLLTLSTVFGFVAYLHGVVRLMRVQYLLETIAKETRLGIEQNFPASSAYRDADAPDPVPAPRPVTYHGRAGVLTAYDLHRLAQLCQRSDCWLELTAAVGEYLAHGTVIVLIHGAAGPSEQQVSRCLLVRGERTFVQDTGFGFRQLVDVAIRALSPAVNDPTTAVQAIDRLGDLLAVVGANPDPTGNHLDSTGRIRIKRHLRTFDELLVLSTTEIVRYGADAPQVVRRLRAVLDELQHSLSADRHAALDRQRDLLENAVSAALPEPFHRVTSTADRLGFG